MVNTVTLDEVEQLAARLPPAERLKLAARICEQLSSAPTAAPSQTDAERRQRERLQLAEELLAEVEDVEDDSQGELDAAAAIRQMREERVQKLCRSGA